MTYETIQCTIPNRKKLKLATEIFKPEGNGPFPVMFLFHGFTGYKEGTDIVDLAGELAEQGFVVIRFTASGFGDSEGTLTEDYRFSNYRSDAEYVYAYVMHLSYVDPKRVGVYGHSMGGKLAVLFCAEHPEVNAVCIGSAPVTFEKTAYAVELDMWKSRGYFEKVSGRDGKIIRIPYTYVTDEESSEHDVLIGASKILSPDALVLAGDADIEVPWTETKRIYEALACQKSFTLLEGVPHKYSQAPDLVSRVTALITKFFITHV